MGESMIENKMYAQRAKQGNIPVMRYCDFNCVYCAFQKFQKISNCQACRKGFNHTHLEVLSRKPPKTVPGKFLTVGLSGDVSFMVGEDFDNVLDYCRKWWDRTFLIQSKNPEYFVQFPHRIPDNVILSTTIESNWSAFKKNKNIPDDTKLIAYNEISLAPYPEKRYNAMLKLNCRKAVTIEPILNFDIDVMVKWIKDINPEFCWVGYDNHDHHLPEPPLEKTLELIAKLREAGIDVREKSIRKAWWQE